MGTGSISGKITIKGKPAVAVTVVANDSTVGSNWMTQRYRARTDQTGSYRLTNLPAGTYEVFPITPALVPANPLEPIVVSDGEQVEDVNYSLVPGGVITGKVKDPEGEPVIGETVNIHPVSPLGSRVEHTMMMRVFSTHNSTDDRGIYRVFGLPPGKYQVSVGRSDRGSGMGNSREYYKETFYPSVSEAAKATVIEVTEGSETDDINIVVGRPVETFRVAGRVIDGETEKPVANMKYGVGQRHGDENSGGSSSSIGNQVTNANGEFRLENVMPGRYTIFTAPSDESGRPSASVTFEVVDRDLTDLVIKTTKGSSLSGVVVVEGNESLPAVLRGLRVYAAVAGANSDFGNTPGSALGPNGAFTISGVRSGAARLGINSFGDNHKRFEVVRVEHNGIPAESINVKEREDVAGIRVVVKYLKLTGAIRGQVKVENGELPPISQLSLFLWPLEDNLEPKRTSSIPSPQLDARGRFFVEGLPAGLYRLSVYVHAATPTPGRTLIVNDTSQQVTVTDDTVTEVTLTIKPRATPNSN